MKNSCSVFSVLCLAVLTVAACSSVVEQSPTVSHAPAITASLGDPIVAEFTSLTRVSYDNFTLNDVTVFVANASGGSLA